MIIIKKHQVDDCSIIWKKRNDRKHKIDIRIKGHFLHWNKNKKKKQKETPIYRSVYIVVNNDNYYFFDIVNEKNQNQNKKKYIRKSQVTHSFTIWYPIIISLIINWPNTNWFEKPKWEEKYWSTQTIPNQKSHQFPTNTRQTNKQTHTKHSGGP